MLSLLSFVFFWAFVRGALTSFVCNGAYALCDTNICSVRVCTVMHIPLDNIMLMYMGNVSKKLDLYLS